MPLYRLRRTVEAKYEKRYGVPSPVCGVERLAAGSVLDARAESYTISNDPYLPSVITLVTADGTWYHDLPADALDAPPPPPSGVAPGCGHWRGAGDGRRPWHYAVSCVVPHCNTPDLLEACVPLLLLQSVPTYVLVIDTGSSPGHLAAAERLRSERVEVHSLKAHGWLTSSSPVAAANDLALALCRTPFLFYTHCDVFLRRRDLVESWMPLAYRHGAAGYGMVPRADAPFAGYVGHAALLAYAPALLRHGVGWSVARAALAAGRWPFLPGGSWPDAEACFNECLRAAGIAPHLTGNESEHYQRTDDLEHVRNVPHGRLYPGLARPNSEAMAQLAVAAAHARAERWSLAPPPRPRAAYLCGHPFPPQRAGWLDALPEEDRLHMLLRPCQECLKTPT